MRRCDKGHPDDVACPECVFAQDPITLGHCRDCAFFTVYESQECKPQDEEEKSCGTLVATESSGECRVRCTPSMTYSMPAGPSIVMGFPQRTEDQWCGEFVPRERVEWYKPETETTASLPSEEKP